MHAMLMTLLLAGAVPQSADDASRQQLAEKMMLARFHLNGIFDEDLQAKVPVAELELPARASDRFDQNGDGFITFDEYEAMSLRSAGGPSEPRDRSSFTHLSDEGFPLNVDPEIVAAADADIGDGDLVMGIVLGGEPRAYPVNYMNGPYNEVVNDELGGQAIAPSW